MTRKLTPAVERDILTIARVGGSIRTAASFAGIGKSALADWLTRGEAETTGPYHALSIAWARAHAQRELDALRVIQRRGREWTAAAWYLERRNPSEWGRRIETSGVSPLGPVRVRARIYLPDNGRGDHSPEPPDREPDTTEQKT